MQMCHHTCIIIPEREDTVCGCYRYGMVLRYVCGGYSILLLQIQLIALTIVTAKPMAWITIIILVFNLYSHAFSSNYR